MNSGKKIAVLILMAAITGFTGMQAGFAFGYTTSTTSEIQVFSPYVQDYQKVRRFEVGLSADNPDSVIFNAVFLNGISATSMAQAGSRTPLVRVKIFYSPSLSTSTSNQLTIDSPSTPYQGETKLEAITNSTCGAKTWMPIGKNSIAFELSRSCVDLPDKFWASLFVDVDVNQNNQDFFNIPDLNAMPLDFSKFPKPKKPEPKRNQLIAGFPEQQSYTLDITTAYFRTTTTSGLPIQISGISPEVCSVTSSTTISLTAAGVCTVSLSAQGNDLWNSAPAVNFSFNVLPKKIAPKVDQNLYFNPPGALYENTGEYELDIYSDSQLEVQVVSSTPSVCVFPYSAPKNTVIRIFSSGTCAFSVKQLGNERYNQREGSTSFLIYAAAKPAPTKSTVKPTPPPAAKKPQAPSGIVILEGRSSVSGGSKTGTSATNGGNVLKFGEKTITCIKGTKTQQLTGKNPKCPNGFREKK